MTTRSLLFTALTAALLATSAPASAEETGGRNIFVGPDPALLWGGVFVSAVPYVASVSVAAESGRSADQALYAPIVGPWLDLGRRSGCPGGTATSCTESTFDILLVADGLLQAVGAASIVTSFLLPDRYRIVHRRVASSGFSVAPLTLKDGGGVAALGWF
jgi:hypothetical protein